MSSNQNNSRFVFISHSSLDTWIAKQIAKEVELCGAIPFLDEANVNIGDEFEDKILEFLDKSHYLIVLFTPWALERPYVWAEIGAAWSNRIPIIVVLHGITSSELQKRPGIPVFIKKRDIIELNEIDKFFLQLKNKIQEFQSGVQ
ncbi:MAG: toll/interleukin-1 receptor domain-containing protein [Candidatus Kuenenia stuttgartiensis]|uniref:TIR domain protein n=1 Tax=Kuenenia stuttgartiensis TaxID=174633 RepID=A0A2C9CJI7_KUEST|nr:MULTISPECIES: toll/interleukin-1 receptor domain-containing protein [Kuenenia]MBW7942018.1 toll/interleukin-1 receptor domain-containing protein [Candidatus Kuenenia stuttgartiensis]MCZ7611940.1 toll/interleukin-1 receptor domain-containing protein [Ignavibacterium sp.]MCZ7620932.1 toll/interleukin-1 receptor domain-containing protein [Candidatus Kuenenia sp.]SOH05882.1 TIR domain protein [Candidatus Kuenenia stuttgartiensis]